MRTEGVSALLVAASQAWFGNSVSFGEVAREQGQATICEWDFMARAGCVFAYGHDLLYARRRAGWYAARVMKGQAPADLPVEQPDAWKLTVNLLAARRVGITVPAPFLPVPMRSSNRAPARAFGPPAHRRGGAAALSRPWSRLRVVQRGIRRRMLRAGSRGPRHPSRKVRKHHGLTRAWRSRRCCRPDDPILPRAATTRPRPGHRQGYGSACTRSNAFWRCRPMRRLRLLLARETPNLVRASSDLRRFEKPLEERGGISALA
jgi:hypothetical protein